MSARSIADERFIPKPDPKILTDPPQGIGKKDNMPPRRNDDDERLERIERAIERLPGNRNDLGAWGRTLATMLVVLVGWFFSALYIAKDTEKDIALRTAVLTTQLEQTRHDFEKYRETTERDMKLLDERCRQISIALEARGLKIPQQ